MRQDSGLSDLLEIEGTLHVDSVHSESLANNPLGDPATRPVGVYVPPGYDPQGSRRYPALDVLHGYTGDVGALIVVAVGAIVFYVARAYRRRQGVNIDQRYREIPIE